MIEFGVKEWNQCLALSLRVKGKSCILRALLVNPVNLMIEHIARHSSRKS